MSDQRFIVRKSFYFKFITLLLSATEIMMNQGFRTINPSQEQTSAKYIFLIALIYHLFAAVSLKIEKHLLAETTLFHISGAIACEALMWILIHDLSGFIIVNMHFLLLVVVLPLCYHYISKVQGTSLSTEERTSHELQNEADPLEISQGGSSSADQMPDLEAQMG